MLAWRGEGDFLELLKADADVSGRLDAAALDALFDPAAAIKHVDTIFRRVFGKA